MTKFFTSDTHWGHNNVIKYSNRPFDDKHHMNKMLIKNWNETVKPTDEVYHLGDAFFMGVAEAQEVLDQLNGKIYLILGNHDQVIKKNKSLQDRFEWIKEYYELNVQDSDAARDSQKLVLCHFPMISWNKMAHGSFMLHGHCHGNLRYPFVGRILDVGVDVHNYKPISYNQVKAHMKPIVPEFLDHHAGDD
jgi:calcineurin-like phosphoesterase family protein